MRTPHASWYLHAKVASGVHRCGLLAIAMFRLEPASRTFGDGRAMTESLQLEHAAADQNKCAAGLLLWMPAFASIAVLIGISIRPCIEALEVQVDASQATDISPVGQ